MLPREAPEPAGRRGAPACAGTASELGGRDETKARLWDDREPGWAEGATGPESATLGGMTKHPGEKSAAERFLDVAFYAPLGLALSALEAVPELARKGRDRLGPQVGVARTVGQFAVRRVTGSSWASPTPSPAITFTLNP